MPHPDKETEALKKLLSEALALLDDAVGILDDCSHRYGLFLTQRVAKLRQGHLNLLKSVGTDNDFLETFNPQNNGNIN